MTTTFKLALRDLLRHRGRTVLAILAVALPVALVLTGLIAAVTMDQQSTHSTAPLHVGTVRVTHSTSDLDAPHRPVTIDEYRRDLAQHTNANVAVRAATNQRYRTTKQFFTANTGWVSTDQNAATHLELTSGRLPRNATEAVVTPVGRRLGIPTTGTVRIADARQYTPITIVGTAQGHGSLSRSAVLRGIAPATSLTDANAAPRLSYYFTVTAPTQTDYNTVQDAFNSVPIKHADQLQQMYSPHKQYDTEWGITTQFISLYQTQSFTFGAFIAFACFLALGGLIIGLLVAPSFAIAAQQHRHTLSTLLRNGATTTQLRRIMTYQGFWVATAGTLGATMITGLILYVPWLRNLVAQWGAGLHQPVVPIIALTEVLVVGFVSVVLAARFTTKRLSTRPDQARTPHPPSPVAAVMGLVCIIATIGLSVAVRNDGAQLLLPLVPLIAAVGMVLLVPTIVRRSTWLAQQLPTIVRFVGRDCARNSNRTSPIVSAIAGATGLYVLGVLFFGLSGPNPELVDTDDGPRQFSLAANYPDTPLSPNVVRDLQQKHPQARFLSASPVLRPMPAGRGADNTKSTPDLTVTAVTPDCDPDVQDTHPSNRCAHVRHGYELPVWVAAHADLVAYFDLSADQAEQLANGAVLAPEPAAPKGVVALNVREPKPQAPQHNTEFQAITYTNTNSVREITPVILTPATAKKFELQPEPAQILVQSSSLIEAHSIVHSAQRATDTVVYVPKLTNHTPPMTNWSTVAVVILGALITVVTLLGVAMNFRAMRNQTHLLAALGSTTAYTRYFVAAQSWWLAVLGIIVGVSFCLGIGVSIVAGIELEATAIFLNRLPWTELGVIALIVPTIAAAFAALLYRPGNVQKRRAS